MSFKSKWNAPEIFRAVSSALNNEYVRSEEVMDSGGATIDGRDLVLNKYICNQNNLILYPAADIKSPKPPEVAIITALSAVAPADFQGKNKLIIPVSEQQKILGRPRNHWVTLTYDFRTSTATIIDSRPRILSFLYPTKHMIKMLKDGLSNANISTMAFKVKHIYQNVQHNDERCGAWTSTNILKQCGHEEYADLNITNLDEIDMVNCHIDRAGSKEEKTQRLEKPESFFQWLKSLFIFSKPCQLPDNAWENMDKSSSTRTMFDGLNVQEQSEFDGEISNKEANHDEKFTDVVEDFSVLESSSLSEDLNEFEDLGLTSCTR